MNMIRSTFAAVVYGICCMLLLQPGEVKAQAGPFADGWVLDSAASSLVFQSVKNGAKVETSRFDSYQGEIDENGVATVRIQLDSVDTNVDLRNVRMRFLFFETFEHPEATITARIDPAAIAGLETKRRLRLPVDFQMALHGTALALQAETVVTLITDDRVSVASASPLTIGVDLFGLEEGVKKLEDAAKVTIMPAGLVYFDFVFERSGGGAGGEPLLVAARAPTPAATAVETTGTFSENECAGRFEILSQAGAIHFPSGSAELSPESRPLLATLIGIVERCPSLEIVVEGHTDSSGSDAANQRLSQARADSVLQYLTINGVPADLVRSIGYGETRPVAPNDTDRNRRRNRRIEFKIASG